MCLSSIGKTKTDPQVLLDGQSNQISKLQVEGETLDQK